MIAYLILTAFTVSIDSFACGFSLAFSIKRKSFVIFGICLTVLLMCTVTNYATALFASTITDKTACIGGLILIIVGIYNLLSSKRKNNDVISKKGDLVQSIVSGFAVGLDGSLANLSLSLMGINAFYVPIIIALFHALAVALGITLAKSRLVNKFGKIEFLPPLILILLGGYKLLGLFI